MIFQIEQTEEFEPTGSDSDLNSRLLAQVVIGGVFHHMEAIAVEWVDDPQWPDAQIQQAADPEWQELLDEYYNAAGGEGFFQTVEINDREYVLCITPYCQ